MYIFFAYAHPVILVFLSVRFRNKASEINKYRYTKAIQVFVYYLEVYYCSLVLMKIISLINDGYFFLWNSTNNLETTLNRLILCFTFYQILVIVVRKLNESAEIDSYTSIKTLIEYLIVCKTYDNLTSYNGYLGTFYNSQIHSQTSMLNSNSIQVLNEIQKLDFYSIGLLEQLELLKIRVHHEIEARSFHWLDSFLLNLFKWEVKYYCGRK